MGFSPTLTFFVFVVLWWKNRCSFKGGYMRKILIISEDAAMIELYKRMNPEDEIHVVSHIGALDVFEKEIPEKIIVGDYTENGSLVRGFQTYHEIAQRLKKGQDLIRVGYEKHDHIDYVKLPSYMEKKRRFRKTV